MPLDDDFFLRKLNTVRVFSYPEIPRMFRPRGSDLNIKIEDYSQVVHMKQMVTIELPRNSALHLNDIVLPLDYTSLPNKTRKLCGWPETYRLQIQTK